MLFECLCFADFLSSEFAKTTALPYNSIMEFIEATAFTKYVYDYLTEDEYLGLQSFLLQNPEAGKIVRGSGGIRKVRWAITGKGKSGGVRVIYYFKKQDDEIWLLTIYSKSEVESIPAHVLRQIAKEIENV
jgi:mRNA-degrading endonuclease RelE of RelBE toxin-antitoxin system